jgi:AcrR family transcriptional regulator
MVPSSHDNPAPAGRPRDPALERAILAAAADALVQHGLTAATVEDVARRAGTGKAAVYRRWPSKTALVIAAARALQPEVAIPDTGSLRADLLACAQHYTAGDERAAIVLASVLGEASRDTELRDAALDAIGRPPAIALQTVISRWIQRGDIHPSVPAELIASIIPAFALRQVLIHRQQLDDHTAAALVDHVLLPALHARDGESNPHGDADPR